MATPRIMIRFRDVTNPAIDLHNEIFSKNGKAYWGVWLKSFEDKDVIMERLTTGGVGEAIYIADTVSKARPTIHVVDVGGVCAPNQVNPSLVPAYYRDKINEVPIWFELQSKIKQIDADGGLAALLGVPTTYFLKYDSESKIVGDAPQREYALTAVSGAKYALHLSDIHLGEDHGFRYPISKDKADISATHTLSDVLVEDLTTVGALGKIGCVIISGDIVTKGSWTRELSVGEKLMSGLDLARIFLEDLSKKLGVAPNLFCMVPGNHDIVREAKGDPTQVQAALLHYGHEVGFRTLREEFSHVYKLSPLNYVARVKYEDRTLVLGLLNSAYLNEIVKFSEYGYVGDDADFVFSIMSAVDERCSTKILVLHHHLLPVYEREPIGSDGRIALTLDAAKLLRQAQEAKIRTVLHGHQHAIKKMSYASWTAEMHGNFQGLKKPLTVFAGGSSGAKGDRLPSGETNSYGLIDISKAEPTVSVRRIYAGGRLGHDWCS